MLDFRRFHGISVALAAVALGVGVCGTCLSGTRSLWADRRLENCPSNFGSLRLAGERLSGVVRSGIPAGVSIGVFLGSSSLAADVQQLALNTEGAEPWRWLRLDGPGARSADLLQMSRLVCRSGVSPREVVLAMHLGMLAEPPPELPPEETRPFNLNLLVGNLRAGRLAALRQDCGTLAAAAQSYFLPKRIQLHYLTKSLAFRARIALNDAFGWGFDSLFQPEPDPWRAPWDWFAGKHGPEEHWRLVERKLGDLGWFRPESYAVGRPASRALCSLLEEARTAGTPVTILLMPEASMIRAGVPGAAERCLEDILARCGGPDGPRVIDLRAAFPDELFHDPTHLDGKGRAAFSERLSRLLPSRGRAADLTVGADSAR